MLRDLKILCTPYDWDVSVPYNLRNFFSTEAKVQLAPTLDLTNFMLETDKFIIRKDRETTLGDSRDRHSLYFLADDIDMTVSDWKKLVDGTNLRDFLYMYNTTGTYSRVKFLVDVYYAGALKFKGTIDTENLTQRFTGDNQDRIIKLRILSWEKEFKDYYKNLGLIGTDELIFTGHKPSDKLFLELLFVLESLFDTVNIQIPEQSIKDWLVCEYPEFHQISTANPLYFPRCGYWNVWQCKENRFDFLQKLCMAMGWVFFFTPNGSAMDLVIKNRTTFDEDITVRQINTKDVIKTDATKLKDQVLFDSVYIDDGTMFGGDECFPNGNDADTDHRGERLVVISNTATVENNSLHFSVVTVGGGIYYVLSSITGDDFSKWWENDDEFASYAIYTYTSSTANDKIVYAKPKDTTLFVGGGHNGNMKQRVQLADGGEAPWPVNADPGSLDDYDMIYSGNYGQMLYQEVEFFAPYHYVEYARGVAYNNVIANQLRDNYKPFLKDRKYNLILESEVKEFNSDQLQILQFIPAEIPYSASDNYLWAITELETDAISDITKYKLVGKVA